MPERLIVLAHCGEADRADMASYLARGGFSALKKARAMGPDAVIEEVRASRLRGRGGAGFPCGAKWAMAASAPEEERFVVCNADEGDVGTFKDRYIIERDPFCLIEGIAIAALAVGARKAYIYLRAEYAFLAERLRTAVDEAGAAGFLAGLAIELRVGAGAYVCGEESALMGSIEGRRPEARFKPPFPTEAGLFGKPTVINNVETLANVPIIIGKGAAWFSAIGTAESAGTKVFSVSGDVARPGVYELVMGSSLAEALELAGAGGVKMVQVGGAAGRVLPASMLDTPLSFETLLGSGGIVVFDSRRDVIEVVSRTMDFLAEESCGLCTPCREGTKVMAGVLGRLASGEGEPSDIRTLEELSGAMMDASVCGLGQSAPVLVLDSLRYFRGDYETRIEQSLYFRTLVDRKR